MESKRVREGGNAQGHPAAPALPGLAGLRRFLVTPHLPGALQSEGS